MRENAEPNAVIAESIKPIPKDFNAKPKPLNVVLKPPTDLDDLFAPLPKASVLPLDCFFKSATSSLSKAVSFLIFSISSEPFYF